MKDNYPLLVIEDCLEYFSGKKYFSTLDLKNGFHQIPMQEDLKQITSFVTPMSQFEYNFMPFGLKNAPSVFQRIINSILKPLIEAKKIVVFIDDISIATATFGEHMQILSELLTLLAEAGLHFNMEKCKFAYFSLKCLLRK